VERNSNNVAAAVKALVPLGADVIVQIVTYSASAACVRAARQAGVGGQFYNVSFVGAQALSEALGKDAEGVVVTRSCPRPSRLRARSRAISWRPSRRAAAS
jgi:ABC-type branched-subunit amino acid transport system substrate-binding protein